MEKCSVIKLKQRGLSNRDIARQTGIHRKTVAKYWREHQEQLKALDDCDDVRVVQELITEKPKYNSSNRHKVKYTPEIDGALDQILLDEERKLATLGHTNKQMLTRAQIHGMLKDQGFDIGITTIQIQVNKKRQKLKEVFIRQEYDFGQRLEYDFGEVSLITGGIKTKYHLAVLASPRADFRWAYLYENQKKEVFMDSHVQFFEMVGGTYKEVVYDNMRNVVSKFIGKNEKELNGDLVKMALYYGFDINVTNCFSGNEKGFVEGSVKIIRNKIFAKRYVFKDVDEARSYLDAELTKLNSASEIEAEKCCLGKYCPPLELSRLSTQNVDKYSFVCVENNFYSVPEYLVGREVVVRNYPMEIIVYNCTNKVCSHKKITGFHEYRVDIYHYLETLAKKPGALKNSKALRSQGELKEVFDTYYSRRPRDFIAILKANTERPLSEIVEICKDRATKAHIISISPKNTMAHNIQKTTRNQLSLLSSMYLGGGRHVAN
jgi:transposase